MKHRLWKQTVVYNAAQKPIANLTVPKFGYIYAFLGIFPSLSSFYGKSIIRNFV